MAAIAGKGVGNVPSASERIFIRLLDSQDQELLLSLKETIDASAGGTDVVLVLGPPKTKQIIKLPGGVNRDGATLEKLRSLAGADNVKIQ